MVVHKCNKEGEIAMMVEQIKNLKATTDRIENKLDKFIDTADNKYATKEELHSLRQDSYRQEKGLEWTKEKIFDIVTKIASLGAIVAFGSKALGLW
jgi:hypothetical protein